MAGISGHNGVVKIDNSSGTLTELTSTVSWDLNTSVAELDVSEQGDADMEYTPGQRSHVVTFSGNWNTTDDAVLRAILGTAGRSIELFPDDDTSGKTKYSGEGFLTAYGRTPGVGAKVGFSATFRISGGVTYGTV